MTTIITVKLVILGNNKTSSGLTPTVQGIPFLLTKDRLELPSSGLPDDMTTIDVAASLLNQLTGLTAVVGGVGWVLLEQLPVLDGVDRIECDEREIVIPYTCLIPTDIKLNEAEWYDFTQQPLSDENRQLVTAAINHN
jgi:hypothetical protein